MGKASITIAITSLFEGNGVERATSSLTKLADRAGWVEKKYSQSATSMSKGMADFAQKLDDAGARMEKYGARVAAVGDSLTAAITVPMVAVGGYAAKMAVDFDTAMANLRKTTDMSARELEEFAQSALELSTVQPVSAETILNTEALGAQLGIARESLEGFAQVATGLDIATNMDAETAATEMARFANIVNMAEGDMERYGSTIVAIGNNMATTESEVSAMAQRFASAGHQAGLSEAEILGLSASMSALGIKAEMGGSALSQVFVKISKAVSSGGDELDAFASRSGMSADEFAKAWGEDAAGAFTALLKGIHDSSEAGEDMNTVLGELGITQIRNSDVMRRMAGSVDQVTEAVQLSTSAWEQNTALQDEVDSRNESMASRLQVLKNKVDEIAITVGRPLVDAVIDALNAMDPAIQAVSDAAHAFAEMDEEGQRNILMWAGMAAAAGPFLSTAGRIVQATGHVTRGVSDVVSKLAIYKDALLTTDGAHMRAYESSKMLSASFGTVNNKAAIAAGGAKNYVSAWEAMYSSAKQVERANVGISESISAAAASSGKAQQKHLENATSLYRVREAAKSTYKENAKLVTSWTGTTKEAEKVAEGVRGLEGELKSVRASLDGASDAAADSGSALGKIGDAAKGAGSSLASMGQKMIAALPNAMLIASVSAAVGALGLAWMKCSENAQKAEEHQRVLNDASETFADVSSKASEAASEQADGYDGICKKAREAAEGVKAMNESAVETMAGFEQSDAKLADYVSTIEELGNKGNLTALEQERLKLAVQGYNEVTGDSVTVTDEVSGSLSKSTDEIKANSEEWRKNAQAQALQKVAQGYIEARVKAELELQRSTAANEEALKRFNSVNSQYESEIRNNGTATLETQKAWESAHKAVSDTQLAVDEASAAFDSASESERQAVEQLALMGENCAALKTTLSGMGEATSAFASMGVDVDAFSVALDEAGVKSETLNQIGSQNIAALAQAFGGNLEMMVWAIQNYNSVPIVDKDGNVNVNDATLVDAQGNLWTWNGTEFVSKNGEVAVKDKELRDAQGRVYTWNGTRLESKSADTSVDSEQVQKDIDRTSKRAKNPPKKQSSDTKVNSASTQTDIDRTARRAKNPPLNQTAKTTINRYENTYRTVYTSNAYKGDHAWGGFAGKVNTVLHARGGIATHAVDVTRHVMGEAGAEALVPLTSKRHAMPFVRMIADETATAMGGRAVQTTVTNNYVLNIDGTRQANIAPAVVEAMGVIFDEFNMTGSMGVR